MNVDSWTVIASDKNRPSGPQSIMDTVVFTRKKLENTVMITNACIRITDGADFSMIGQRDGLFIKYTIP